MGESNSDLPAEFKPPWQASVKRILTDDPRRLVLLSTLLSTGLGVSVRRACLTHAAAGAQWVYLTR